LGKVVSDADNLIHALRSQWSVEVDSIRYGVLKILPDTIRRSGWKIQVVVRDREVIDLRENGDQSIYGLAVDVGTSKLVLQLVELGSGVTVGVESMENPQIVHGEDIYSRMSYAMAGPDRRDELSRLVIQGINSLISEICVKKGVNSEQVYEMVVVGNTAMHHLFLGLPTRHLALSPFVPVIERGMDFSPKDLSVNINPYGNVYMFPVIAGFVGGDAVADIIATGIHRSEKFNLLVDIGTNTEICLGNRDSLICCSCASGPAFEGYHITYGVKAIRGAIERVRILSTSKVEYQTVEGARPVGICGSGMVDALAEMLRNRILTTDGRFNPQLRDALPKYNGTPAFTIAPAEETLIGEAILVTQKDVRELQLAKAAIMTGCKALLEEKNVCEEEVETVYVAGAFGSYLNIRSAIAIGMLPQIPPERFRIVGNTAVVGAKLGLISTSQREEAENIARVAEYLELGARPSFNKEFTQALEFPNIGEP
ncbi:MAG: ASKHA domain-containing protein, partial [Candidatus Bathyarchaeia archaeon]